MTEPMSDERLEDLAVLTRTTPTFRVDVIDALLGLDAALQEIRRLREENARLKQVIKDLTTETMPRNLTGHDWADFTRVCHDRYCSGSCCKPLCEKCFTEEEREENQ